MNDESVTPLLRAPLNMKNAYVLFYQRAVGSSLLSAIHSASSSALPSSQLAAPAEIFSAKDRADKRKRVAQDDEEDLGIKASPQLSSSQPDTQISKRPKLADATIPLSDPAATTLKARIAAVTAVKKKPPRKTILAEYDGQSSETEDADIKPGSSDPSSSATVVASSSVLDLPSTPPSQTSKAVIKDIFPSPSPLTPASQPVASTSASVDAPTTEPESIRAVNAGIPPERFYGSKSSELRKSKHAHNSDENDRHYDGHLNGKRNSGEFGRFNHNHGNQHRWKINGANAFTAAALRDNLHEDRSGPSSNGNRKGAAGWSAVVQSKKRRMNGRKKSLM